MTSGDRDVYGRGEGALGSIGGLAAESNVASPAPYGRRALPGWDDRAETGDPPTVRGRRSLPPEPDPPSRRPSAGRRAILPDDWDDEAPEPPAVSPRPAVAAPSRVTPERDPAPTRHDRLRTDGAPAAPAPSGRTPAPRPGPSPYAPPRPTVAGRPDPVTPRVASGGRDVDDVPSRATSGFLRTPWAEEPAARRAFAASPATPAPPEVARPRPGPASPGRASQPPASTAPTARPTRPDAPVSPTVVRGPAGDQPLERRRAEARGSGDTSSRPAGPARPGTGATRSPWAPSPATEHPDGSSRDPAAGARPGPSGLAVRGHDPRRRVTDRSAERGPDSAAPPTRDRADDTLVRPAATGSRTPASVTSPGVPAAATAATEVDGTLVRPVAATASPTPASAHSPAPPRGPSSPDRLDDEPAARAPRPRKRRSRLPLVAAVLVLVLVLGAIVFLQVNRPTATATGVGSAPGSSQPRVMSLAPGAGRPAELKGWLESKGFACTSEGAPGIESYLCLLPGMHQTTAYVGGTGAGLGRVAMSTPYDPSQISTEVQDHLLQAVLAGPDEVAAAKQALADGTPQVPANLTQGTLTIRGSVGRALTVNAEGWPSLERQRFKVEPAQVPATLQPVGYTCKEEKAQIDCTRSIGDMTLVVSTFPGGNGLRYIRLRVSGSDPGVVQQALVSEAGTLLPLFTTQAVADAFQQQVTDGTAYVFADSFLLDYYPASASSVRATLYLGPACWTGDALSC